MNSLAAITENYSKLSKNEKKVADFLLTGDNNLYSYTVQKLAENTVGSFFYISVQV